MGGVDLTDARILPVSCEAMCDPGADVATAMPRVIAHAQAVVAEHNHVRAILLESFDLSPYADAVRAATGLPVYDAITANNAMMAGWQDSGALLGYCACSCDARGSVRASTAAASPVLAK